MSTAPGSPTFSAEGAYGWPFPIWVCLRYLRDDKLQTLLILSGVTVGVAVIIFLTTLISQLQTSIIDKTLGSQAHIVLKAPRSENRRLLPPESTAALVEPRSQRISPVDQWESMATLTRHEPGVEAVSPLASGSAFAVRGQGNQPVVILGVDAVPYQGIVNMGSKMVAGSFTVQGTQVVIGTELAKDLGVTLGDKLRLVTIEGRSDTLTVAGLFDLGNRDLNRRWVYTSLKMAQTLLDIPGGVTQIDVRVRDLFNAETLALRLNQQTGLNADSWMQTNAQLLTALKSQSMTNNLIRVFVALIVAIGIASVLVVSVLQKQKEIGILRAMGATPRSIMQVFLLQGSIYGMLGSALGCALSFALLTLFSKLTRNPDGSSLVNAQIEPSVVLGACLLAVLIGLMAAAVPARRAARLDPVEAIRL